VLKDVGAKTEEIVLRSINDPEECDLVESMQGYRDESLNAQWEGLVTP